MSVYQLIRLWQVVSHGYAQSISLLTFLPKYQSPTASEMLCQHGQPNIHSDACYIYWCETKQLSLFRLNVINHIQWMAKERFENDKITKWTLLCTLGESGANQVSCDSLWQWAKQELIYIPPLVELAKKGCSVWSM